MPTIEVKHLAVTKGLTLHPGDILVIYQNQIIDKISPAAGEPQHPSPTDQIILKLLADHGSLTAEAMGNVLGFNRSDRNGRGIISRLILKLKQSGHIVSADSRARPAYKLTDKQLTLEV